MKAIWKLFVGDVKRLTSNVVSVIIVIGLTVLPALFTWFNVAASWDPFSNTGNLKFAVANVDAGYKSDLTGPSPPKRRPSMARNPANTMPPSSFRRISASA